MTFVHNCGKNRKLDNAIYWWGYEDMGMLLYKFRSALTHSRRRLEPMMDVASD